MDVGRFAPSSTGRAHPGTLLAALLCWLDVRSRGGRIRLRLEDLDPQRASARHSRGLVDDFAWLGLDWDVVEFQSEAREAHAEALDRLEGSGRLYPCECSRSQIAAGAARAPDGGFRYPGRCLGRALPAGGWRKSSESLRVRLDDSEVAVPSEDASVPPSNPRRDFGDPLVRRRDGVAAYHLASVVDDANGGVTRVVRGRDLALHTPIQVALQRLLDLETPAYRHHLLLLERREGAKLAKFHGAVAADELRAVYSGPALCGLLAMAAGLLDAPREITPTELLTDFDWARVRSGDRELAFTGSGLQLA